MSGEIVVPETPNWLNDLEAKREKRLKARLGHEAGAGAPCLKCGDKCPGLDLHFWRKACKACRCPKEEHDVPDDDIYGWAQFQLLGSKPNKVKTKIVLPGKNDEVELEWAPKGQKEIIDKYLKTLPPEALPVKGSQAAQDRKQLLQKQIPIHDIDPTLCHELNEEEVNKMEEYIAHVKKSSVGVGQIVNLSSVIKANLHNISPQEAHIMATRFSKGVPFSEIVKMQSGLAQNLENLTLKPKTMKHHSGLPAMQPNKISGNLSEENLQNSLPVSKFKDITHPWYTNASTGKAALNPQYSENVKNRQPGDQNLQRPTQDNEYTLNEKLLQGTNFDPSKTPSQFSGYHTPGYRQPQYGGRPTQDQPNQEAIGYDRTSLQRPTDDPYGSASDRTTSEPYGEDLQGHRPSQHADNYGFENPYFNQSRPDHKYGPNPATAGQQRLPGYSPTKYDPLSESRDPQVLRSVKDLIYSTYDPSKGPIPHDQHENVGGNGNLDPRMPGYDPNAAFSSYKLDPSVVRHEHLPLAEKNNPATLLGGDLVGGQHQYEPRNSAAKHGLAKFDPVTGKYVLEEQRYPESFSDKQKTYGSISPRQPGLYDPNPTSGKYGSEGPGYPKVGIRDKQYPYGPNNPDPAGPHGKVIYDPTTGKYVSEEPRNPPPGSDGFEDDQLPYGAMNPRQPGTHGKVIYDPTTGKYVSEEPKNPAAEKDDSRYDQLPYGSRTSHQPGLYGEVIYDPTIGKYISEDPRHPEGGDGFGDDQHPYGPTNSHQPGLHGKVIYDPTTGKYISKDPRNFAAGNDGSGTHGKVIYDPTTGRYVTEEPKNTEAESADQPPYGTINTGLGIYDPKTGRYVANDGSPAASDKYGSYRPDKINSGPNKPNVAEHVKCFDNSDPNGLEHENRNPYAGHPHFSPSKTRKPLSSLQPGHMNIPEDYLEPHMVNVGAIQDINPEIRAATTEVNPGYDDGSVYGDNGAEYSPESIREILNNIKLPDCHYCKKPFEENEFAVTIDRANVLFHAQCFKCAGCNQSLADNIYFYHKDTNNVYCGRDYAKIKGYPRCTACDELIFTKEYCLAENSTFHLKHFCCFQCDTPLAGQDYTLEDEKPYCLPCYETSKAAQCSTCENVIKPDEVGCQLNGVHFHAEDRCFRCIVCGLPLMGKKLLLRNEKLYCSHDCFNTGKK